MYFNINDDSSYFDGDSLFADSLGIIGNNDTAFSTNILSLLEEGSISCRFESVVMSQRTLKSCSLIMMLKLLLVVDIAYMIPTWRKASVFGETDHAWTVADNMIMTVIDVGSVLSTLRQYSCHHNSSDH